jgi:hypothetical protein
VPPPAQNNIFFLTQVTDVIVTEDFEGAPAPATITTIDEAGNMNERQVAPEDIGSALADAFGIGGAPSPGESPCPTICSAAILSAASCANALDTLCQLSGGALCLTASDVCPVPDFCASCTAGTSSAPAPESM